MTQAAGGTPPGDEGAPLKKRAANALKWNLIDKVGSQLLYAVTGVVLARELSQADFGLIGAIAVFQALGTLFVDSGFSSALIQRKDTTEADWSTVFWFNLGVALALWGALWPLAPWISRIFGGDPRLVPLARVMFLTFPLGALSLVPVSRFVKAMNVKPVALATNAGLFTGCAVGVGMAVAGCGAWAIVGQALALAVVKAALLWRTSRWLPSLIFSRQRLASIFKVGAGVMGTSLLNTLFQNITAFFTGNRVGIVALGYFTQADKWSKMGVMSLSQVLTSTFLPVLSQAQDDGPRFARLASKTHRLTAYLVFPCMAFLAVLAQPIFHALFGTKWDAAVPLFQALLAKGVFTALTLQNSNMLLSLGKSGRLVVAEAVRDAASAGAILLTLPWLALTSPANPVEGVEIFVWGQVAASGVAWLVVLGMTAAAVRERRAAGWLADLAPYAVITLAACLAMWGAMQLSANAWVQMALGLAAGTAAYLGINALLRSRIQADALAWLLRRPNQTL